MEQDIAIVTTFESGDRGSAQSIQQCTRCGASALESALTRSAFWNDDQLVVIENIPAIVCSSCHEQYYSDDTVVRLDLLRGEGFPAELSVRQMTVPVFSLTPAEDVEEMDA